MYSIKCRCIILIVFLLWFSSGCQATLGKKENHQFTSDNSQSVVQNDTLDVPKTSNELKPEHKPAKKESNDSLQVNSSTAKTEVVDSKVLISNNKTVTGIDLSKFEGILTFDDGPHPKTTPHIVKQLQSAKVKNAIFFFVGYQMKKYPKLVRLVEQADFEIGYHSMHHDNQVSLTVEQISNDIKLFKKTLQAALGKDYPLRYGRPPYGGMTKKTVKRFWAIEKSGKLAKQPLNQTFNISIVDSKIISAFKKHRMRLWLWNIDFDDWKKPISKGLQHAANSYIAGRKQVWLFHELPKNKIATQFHLMLKQIQKLEKKFH